MAFGGGLRPSMRVGSFERESVTHAAGQKPPERHQASSRISLTCAAVSIRRGFIRTGG